MIPPPLTFVNTFFTIIVKYIICQNRGLLRTRSGRKSSPAVCLLFISSRLIGFLTAEQITDYPVGTEHGCIIDRVRVGDPDFEWIRANEPAAD